MNEFYKMNLLNIYQRVNNYKINELGIQPTAIELLFGISVGWCKDFKDVMSDYLSLTKGQVND